MIRKIFRWIWKATLWFIALSILSVIIFKWVPVPITPLMMTRAIDNKMEGKEFKLVSMILVLYPKSFYLQPMVLLKN